MHTALLANIGGKRIGFGATETYWNAKPRVYIVDFTDYAHPNFLSVWHPSGIPDDRGGVFTTDNFQVVGDKLYVSVWHAGVWGLDVSDPAHPREVAVRVPVHDTGFPVKGGRLQAGNVLIVLASDVPAGVEGLRFAGDPAGDASYQSFG